MFERFIHQSGSRHGLRMAGCALVDIVRVEVAKLCFLGKNALVYFYIGMWSKGNRIELKLLFR